MKILTAKQMARFDRLSIVKHHISAQKLMAQAAQVCVQELLERFPLSLRERESIVIVCGPGNNGGDGFAMAHFLAQQGYASTCFFTGKVEKLSKEARYFYQQLSTPPQPLQRSSHLLAFRRQLTKASVVVDALFGTGLARPLTGFYAQILSAMNRSSAKKLAVDMPSGVSGDTGEVLGSALVADVTVTFEVPKWGQLQRPAWNFVGDLVVRSIGLSRQELKKMKALGEWVDSTMVRSFLKPRSRDVHKGSFGKVLVVAGSQKMPGAGYLSALGALRVGAGTVTWAMPEEAFQRLDMSHPEVMLHSFPSAQGKFAPTDLSAVAKREGGLKSWIKGFDVVALGPGLGQGSGVAQFLQQVLKNISLPFVIDADGLNLIAKHPKLFKFLRGKILTPHPKEMARLTGLSTSQVLQERVPIAKKFAKRYGVYLILKGYRSVLTTPAGKVYINSTGSPNLAVAGSGDVLTGAIAGLLAQGLSRQRAMLTGSYLHGRAGDRLAKIYGDRGTLASEVAKELPGAIQEIL